MDFEHVKNNRFVAVNQLEIRSRKRGKRIPDIIGFVNGLPLVVFELKIRCVNQRICCRRLISLKPIKMRLPSCLFTTKPLIISDGIAARLGSLSADFQRFTPWKVVDEKNKSSALIF